ncbi:MAG: serine/threonine-protein kinase [Gemmatimonadales bacterium]|nr:serine/threonine-protein kinase [Gemmatimonadales bacterium]
MPDLPADLVAAVRERYALERELGRGGMATVYLAQDLKHRRQVAIKVLKPELAAVLGAERFLREIETTASLRHPHILPLYDSGEAGSLLYYVMPLVEGESLRDRMDRERQFPLDDALQIAREVADALSYAHRHGVVHRDIKPGNILLESGHAVVADFGIARAIDAAGGDRLTETGLALGTLTYMSPEQVAGSPDLDGRSDLYSLGCVLYEMLAGEPPFTGPTAASMARQQMVAEPRPVTQLRPAVPADVAAAVGRTLAKVPADRWRDAEELRHRLDGLRKHTSGGAASLPRPRAAPAGGSRRRRWILLSATAAVCGLLALVASRLTRRGAPEVQIGRRTQVTLGPGLEVHPSLSPNGDLLAYTAGRESRLFVRQVEGGSAIPIARGLPGLQGWPHWSPDGKQLTFSSTRGIEIVPALGGTPRLLAPAPAAIPRGTIIVGGPWSPDGREVAFVRGDTLHAVPVTGGTPRVITTGPTLHSCAWSPDGRRIACVSGNFEAMTLGPFFGNLAQSAILIVPSAGGRPARLIDDGYANASPAWLPDGTLLFLSNREGGRDVYAVRLDGDGRAAGPPNRITTGLNALSITIPANGSRIGYAAFAEISNIWSMPVPAGAPGAIDEAKQITTGSQVIEWFDLSQDGRRLVFDSDRSGNADLYRMALDGAGEPEQVTRDSVDEFWPAWSPDGREIAFHSFREGHRQIYLIPGDGGASQLVARTQDDDRIATWMPDGLGLLTLTNYGAPGAETRIIRRTGKGRWSNPARWRKPPCMASWSPDGSLAACAELSGRLLLTNPQGDSLRVLVDSGLIPDMAQFPQWSSDGRTLYYLGMDSVSTSVHAAPVGGGRSQLVLRFDDPTRPWHRYGFRMLHGRFYFTIGDRQSHVWVGTIGSR